ncbi:MAG: hypothetical protein ABI193_21665 [Minicystis sp.]
MSRGGNPRREPAAPPESQMRAALLPPAPLLALAVGDLLEQRDGDGETAQLTVWTVTELRPLPELGLGVMGVLIVTGTRSWWSDLAHLTPERGWTRLALPPVPADLLAGASTVRADVAPPPSMRTAASRLCGCCTSLEAESCARHPPGARSWACSCACHGGPGGDPEQLELPPPATTPAIERAWPREVWALAERFTGADLERTKGAECSARCWKETGELVDLFGHAMRALSPRPLLVAPAPARAGSSSYPTLGDLELSPEVIDVLERADAAMQACGGVSWASYLTETRRIVRAVAGVS